MSVWNNEIKHELMNIIRSCFTINLIKPQTGPKPKILSDIRNKQWYDDYRQEFNSNLLNKKGRMNIILSCGQRVYCLGHTLPHVRFQTPLRPFQQRHL